MRVAVYYAPEREDPLWHAGCTWLGRDPETETALPQPDLPDIGRITEEARRYAFHATLKAPMRLATDWTAFRRDAAAHASRLPPFDLPRLAVADLSGFLALRETVPCPALHALADSCITALDPHRAPPPPEELARRRQARLSPLEEEMLARWGYPYAGPAWRFHMTLTCRLSSDDQARIRPIAAAHFATALAAPRRVGQIALFTESEPGAPFRLAERLRLTG